MSAPRPDPATLRAWGRRWRAIKLAAYRELVASYTPEQREIVARMHHASHQGSLCGQRARFPDGSTGKRRAVVAWPEEPPQAP